jgi:hypothetical protein
VAAANIHFHVAIEDEAHKKKREHITAKSGASVRAKSFGFIQKQLLAFY